jgi:hypothetical protein
MRFIPLFFGLTIWTIAGAVTRMPVHTFEVGYAVIILISIGLWIALTDHDADLEERGRWKAEHPGEEYPRRRWRDLWPR